MADKQDDKKVTTVVTPSAEKQRDDQPTSMKEQLKAFGGEEGKKAPTLGSDPRPAATVEPARSEQEVRDNVEKGKLGDGGPSSDAKGKNQGNLREEEEQHPTQNATAGGPDVGQTPANAPGMSHS